MILIPGASGLVGLHLLQSISHSGNKIIALYHSQIPPLLENTVEQNIIWKQCDITDMTALESCFEKITHVYHCAAMVSYDPRLKEEMMNVNVNGTQNVVNLCLDKNIEKLVFISSIATLSQAEDGLLITEKSPWDESEKHSAYSLSKYYAEMEVWRGAAEGLTVAIVNPGIILGEGNHTKSSTNLFQLIYNEFPYYTNGVTAWVDVKDVVKAAILLMKSTIQQERFIVSAGNFSYKEIFTWMANAMGKKPPHKAASKFWSEVVWRISYLKSKLSGKVATLTKETARTAHKIQKFDNQKFLKAMPDFEYSNIQETINRVGNYLFC